MVDKFTNDSVIDFTPITFAGAFIKRMRKNRQIVNIPSIRSTIAIPKFLTARYFRKEKLDPLDYFSAAVHTTPPEDQYIAEKIARELLFPKKVERVSKKKQKGEDKPDSSQSKISGLDQILSELSNAGFDDLLDVMNDETDLEDLMEDQDKSWAMLDNLLSSDDILDKARLDLLDELNSEFAIIEHYLDQRELIDNFLKQQLAQTAGTWSPRIFQPAVNLQFTELLERQSQMPWEIATVLGLVDGKELKQYLEQLLQENNAYTLGKTLKYLNNNQISVSNMWQTRAFDKIRSMTDYYELLQGMGYYRPPPKNLIANEEISNIKQNLDLAEQIQEQFQHDHQPNLFKHFIDKTDKKSPTLNQVLNATYDDGDNSWEQLLEEAVNQKVKNISRKELVKLAEEIINHQSKRLTPQMKYFQANLAKEIATKSIEKVKVVEQFMSQLEHLSDVDALPDYQRTLSAGKKLGIAEPEISTFFKDAIQVLKSYIDVNHHISRDYDRISRKINKISQTDMSEMISKSMDLGNQYALATLGTINLGLAISCGKDKFSNGKSGDELIVDALDKSIGGGTNLLKQWFMHRKSLSKNLKDRLKVMMKDILLEIGIDWANRGIGSTEEGIIPVSRNRPYRPGDELDMIDIQATLDTLMMSGKTLEQITQDELMVFETSKGKTALGILIDISGSMSGKNLAMCAIAVVMLLGKLEEEEIAVALFESDTHKIKGFDQNISLDEVADELLDLTARGGTRANQALKWISKEFEDRVESEVKILYFLSDYYLSEGVSELEQLCEPMRYLGVKLLGTSHGHYDKRRMNVMVNQLSGNTLHIKDFDSLPKKITEAISSIT